MSDYEIRRWNIRQVIALTKLMLPVGYSFFFIFFFLSCKKALEVLNISYPSSNYPDLLLEMRKYYFEFFYFVCSGISNCFLRYQSGKSPVKCLYQKHNRIVRGGFKQELYWKKILICFVLTNHLTYDIVSFW